MNEEFPGRGRATSLYYNDLRYRHVISSLNLARINSSCMYGAFVMLSCMMHVRIQVLVLSLYLSFGMVYSFTESN